EGPYQATATSGQSAVPGALCWTGWALHAFRKLLQGQAVVKETEPLREVVTFLRASTGAVGSGDRGKNSSLRSHKVFSPDPRTALAQSQTPCLQSPRIISGGPSLCRPRGRILVDISETPGNSNCAHLEST
ncbi:mCG141835, partial [Mus musculus]